MGLTTTAQTINLYIIKSWQSVDNGSLKEVTSAYQIDVREDGIVDFWGVEVKGYIDFSTKEVDWTENGEVTYYWGTISTYGKTVKALWFLNNNFTNGVFGVVFEEAGRNILFMHEYQ